MVRRRLPLPYPAKRKGKHMCLAIPGTISKIEEETATIDYGGTTRRASVRLLPDAAVGDCVLVHAGFVIQKVDPDEGAELEALLREVELL